MARGSLKTMDMKKKETTVLLEEGEVFRVGLFAQRRDGWSRLRSGELSVAEPAPEESAQPGEELLQEAGELAADDTARVRALKEVCKEFGSADVTVGLPLSELLVRMLKLPMEAREDLASAVALQLGKYSPYSEEELTVGYETLGETEDAIWVFAAAVPEVAVFRIEGEMELAGLRPARIDASFLGWFRALCAPCDWMKPERRVALLNVSGEWDLLVVEAGIPRLVRNIGESEPAAIARQAMLSMFETEQTSPGEAVKEVQIVHFPENDISAVQTALSALLDVPLRTIPVEDTEDGLNGLMQDIAERSTFDLTPQAWKENHAALGVFNKVAFASKIALGLWVALFLFLVGGPIVTEKMTEFVRKQSRSHQKAYKKVSDTRDRVNLIKSYTDRTKSPLEMLKLISENLPQGIDLVDITYRKTDGVRVKGEANDPSLVYKFKDALSANEVFDKVTLTGPAQKKGRHTFDVNAQFPAQEEKKQ